MNPVLCGFLAVITAALLISVVWTAYDYLKRQEY